MHFKNLVGLNLDTPWFDPFRQTQATRASMPSRNGSNPSLPEQALKFHSVPQTFLSYTNISFLVGVTPWQ